MFTLEIFSRSFLISLNIHIISFGVAPEFSINFKIISLLALGYNNKNIFNIKYPKSYTRRRTRMILGLNLVTIDISSISN